MGRDLYGSGYVCGEWLSGEWPEGKWSMWEWLLMWGYVCLHTYVGQSYEDPMLIYHMYVQFSWPGVTVHESQRVIFTGLNCNLTSG